MTDFDKSKFDPKAAAEARKKCGLSSKIDPLFRLNLTHPNDFRVWVSFFIISDFYTVI